MCTQPSMTSSSRASPISTRKYVVGNPLDQATTLGPMARSALRRHGARADRRSAAQGREGAHQHEGGRRPTGSPYLAPEVLTNVNHQMEVMREESFGPVVGIMKVHDDDEASTLMNDSPYGLTASIWTRDTDRAAELGSRDRDRHGLHEPLRLSRPGARLDRRQGHRTRCGAVEYRLRRSDPAQELSPPRRLTTPPDRKQDMSVPTANWSYPDRHPLRRRAHQGACRCLPGRGNQAPAPRHRCWPCETAHHNANNDPLEGSRASRGAVRRRAVEPG